MKITSTPLEGMFIIEPRCFQDERGFFLETYQEQRYHEAGIVEKFVQENHSRSGKNVLRGMHFTKNSPQAQIVTVIHGRIFDVVVDIRKNSPTFGKWFGTELNDQGPRQIYMAHGFAHCFCVLSDYADLHYKVSQRYEASDEGGLIWNDRDVNINWPIKDPVISARDQRHQKLEKFNGN